jgi:hypothetical protein
MRDFLSSGFGRAAVALPAAAALALMPMPASDAFAQQAQHVAAATNGNFPLSDARNIGPSSVRFSAAQGTAERPNIALFGVAKDRWPVIRDAIKQSVTDGYPVRVVFMGPMDAPPSLEIYAKGTLVTRPIDPNTITPAALTNLIHSVNREMYPTALASRISYPSVER